MLTPNNTNLAYDFDLFDTDVKNEKEKKKKEIREEVQIIKNSAAKSGNMFKILVICAAAVIIAYVFLTSKANISELSAAINSETKQLEQAVQENIRLQTMLDNMVSLPKVEEFARDELGLAKISSAQEKHITLGTEDMTEVADNGNTPWYEEVSNWFNGIKEYLGF